ncbi:unnamed protein product [Symbiodinium microadriaticum]|nr:unnamed protein product [Symbiodinium microadriaticum]
MAPKRKAAGKPAEEPLAKQNATILKKLGVSQRSFNKVMEALTHPLAEIPEACQHMLLAGLAHSLCVPVDERHEVQNQVVTMIEEEGVVDEDIQEESGSHEEAVADEYGGDQEEIPTDELCNNGEDDDHVEEEEVEEAELEPAAAEEFLENINDAQAEELEGEGDGEVLDAEEASAPEELSAQADVTQLQQEEEAANPNVEAMEPSEDSAEEVSPEVASEEQDAEAAPDQEDTAEDVDGAAKEMEAEEEAAPEEAEDAPEQEVVEEAAPDQVQEDTAEDVEGAEKEMEAEEEAAPEEAEDAPEQEVVEEALDGIRLGAPGRLGSLCAQLLSVATEVAEKERGGFIRVSSSLSREIGTQRVDLKCVRQVVEARQAESTGAAAQPELSQKKPAAKKKPTAVEKHLQECDHENQSFTESRLSSELRPEGQGNPGGTFTCRYVYSQARIDADLCSLLAAGLWFVLANRRHSQWILESRSGEELGIFGRLRLRAEATAEALFCFADVLQLRLWAWFAPSIAEHTAILGSLQVALDTENDKVAGAEAKMAELDQTVKDAEVSLQAAKAYTSECEAKLKTASEAVCTSKATLTQRLNEQKKGDEGIVKARADKELLESTKSECFEKLKSGGAVAKEAKQLLKKIEPFIKQTGSDASLITAAPATLLKPPEERGSFDQIVLEQLEANFTAKLTEFETQLAEAAPAAEARAEEEVQKAQSTHEAAESKQKEASVELCAAKEAQKEANAVVAAAKKAVADYRPDYQAATATRDAKKEELETYVDGSLATFKELKERISAKKRRELAAAAKEEAAKALAEEAPAEEPEQDTAAGQ